MSHGRRRRINHLVLGLDSVVAKEGLWVLFPLVTSDGLPPGICAPTDDSLCASERRGGRPNIQVEDGFSCGLGLSRVVVDDISNLFLFAVDFS